MDPFPLYCIPCTPTPGTQRGDDFLMDGGRRTVHNIFVERFWHTVKYENSYLMDYDPVAALEEGLTRYFPFYHSEYFH